MPTITRLPLDLSGKAVTNLRKNESRNVVRATGKVNRIIIPYFGAYYTDSMEVRDVNGVLLKHRVNVEFTYHYEIFGQVTGKGVAAMVVITDPTLQGPFSITYQAVGGNFSLSYLELKDIIDYIATSDQKIKWEDIIDKPTAYIPAPHTHEWWQLYGMDSLVDALRRLADKWATGTSGIVGSNSGYYKDYLLQMQAALDDYLNRVNAHIQDRNNPHKTDKVKIGLSNINNWPLANYAQSIDRSINNYYQPIGGVYNQLITTVIPILNSHITDRATPTHPDPHNTTLAQLGLYSVDQIKALFDNRLLRTDSAVGTTLLAGATYETIYNASRTNLDASNVDPNTRFTQDKLGELPPGADPTKYVLTGDNKYTPIENFVKKYLNLSASVYFAGGGIAYATAQAAIERFNWVKPGSVVVGNYAKLYGNWTYQPGLVLAKRTEAGGWIYLNPA